MAIEQVNVGTTANDGTGDTLRAAFQKYNAAMLLAAEKVATRVALRAITLVGAGRVVLLTGGVTENDGEGGSYFYDTTSAVADNDATVIKPTSVTGAGRWIKWL